MRLSIKVIGAAIITLAICIGGASVFMVSIAKQRMVATNAKHLAALGSIARMEAESITPEGHSYAIQRLLENMQKTPGMIAVRIISIEGSIVSSSLKAEAGQISKSGYSMPDKVPHTTRVDNALLHRIPIGNRSECFSCHGNTAKYLGIMELEYDISKDAGDVLSTRRFLLLSGFLTIFIVAGVLTAILNRTVTFPLELIGDCIRSIREGDLNARITLQGRDEISELGKGFNEMLGEITDVHERTLAKEREISRVKAELDHKVMLEELNTQLQHKVKEVESANKAVLSLSKELKHKNVELEKMVERLKRINEVGSVLTSIIDHKELLKIIIKTASETLHVKEGTIHVKRSNNPTITLTYKPNSGFVEGGTINPELDPRFQNLVIEGKQVFQDSDAGKNRSSKKKVLGVPLRMKGQIIGGILLEGDNLIHHDLEVLETMTNQAVVALENAWLYETVKANYFGTIQSLVNALEASDRYTKGHSERVRFLGIELAKYIGMDYRELEVLEHAAILHDIGKIGIDTSVLNKEDALTNTEFSLIRAHPIIGDEILGPIGTLNGVRTTILQHHERYDGKGYPYGISGEEITLKARVLAVIDTFDAMLTDRPYRKALTREQALDEVRKGSGTQFDPAVVKSFLNMLKEKEELMGSAGYYAHN